MNLSHMSRQHPSRHRLLRRTGIGLLNIDFLSCLRDRHARMGQDARPVSSVRPGRLFPVLAEGESLEELF